ncbi:hypothetical protein FF100_21245 [Methylobacterium terricola]|uniref:CopL family metal-binding regulatory protein n=1 Tax=Methylobacterium terricola TaxID=2583531 RepID=A0A5C4LER2_9HYPH|nr:hypothetical protein [Methylobacterium terricola]TNC11124.1 hypothetical protein FF100_21245 [Methylobacterium terricola]
MSLDRPIARLLAAMILAIIAYAVPSAVQAHEGHAHHAHHGAAGPAPQATAPSASVTPKVALAPVAAEAARLMPTHDHRCRSGCGTRCCATMACCATCILPGSSLVSPSLFRAVTLIPRDLPRLAGIGPEALPEPPRTRA